MGGDANVSTQDRTSKECRLIINWDMQNMWAVQLYYAQRERKLEPEGIKAALEQIVDEHAKAKVDRIVHCLFALPWGTGGPGFQSFNRVPAFVGWHTGAIHDTDTGVADFEEAGYDLAQVLLDRSRKNGVQFLGGLRMNDRHPGSRTTPFYTEHPEWRLKECLATGAYFGGMDYKYEGVRKAVLAFTEEFLGRYDVDGIELDWMRWCHMFNPSEAQANAPILTQFTAQMRKLVDETARKRGRAKLLLGVRIPQSMEECAALGFDVKAWVRKGLVDYINPSDFAVTDYNMRTEDFVALTKGTQCRVYPSVHPQHVDFSLAQGRETPVHSAESYRAAAKNYYAHGADGIEAYNYQDHWYSPFGSEDDWPRALSYLTGLRDPKAVARGDRRYMYYPTSPGTAVTGAVKVEKIVLEGKAGQPAGSLPFRMAEDLNDAHLSATLEFKVTGMAEGDRIEVKLNGTAIPADRIGRRHYGDVQPAFHLYRMPLSSPPATSGDNELRLRLSKSAGTGKLVAQEIEVLVRDNRP